MPHDIVTPAASAENEAEKLMAKIATLKTRMCPPTLRSALLIASEDYNCHEADCKAESAGWILDLPLHTFFGGISDSRDRTSESFKDLPAV
jgi:hypothetical protein